jgi:hypothetical protein
MTAITDSALPPALGPSSYSLVVLIVGLVALISSVSLLVDGAMLPDPLSLPMDIPGVVVNRVAAAPVVPGRDAVQGTGVLRFHVTANESTVADRGASLAMTHEHLGAVPAARVSTGADGRKQTNRTTADPAAELARGTRAESAQLATIETRWDDPRALLLRTAAWSRDRGRTNA